MFVALVVGPLLRHRSVLYIVVVGWGLGAHGMVGLVGARQFFLALVGAGHRLFARVWLAGVCVYCIWAVTSTGH